MRIARIAVSLTIPALLVGSLAACSSSSKSGNGATGGAAGVPAAAPNLDPKGEMLAAAAVMQKAGSANVTMSTPGDTSGDGTGVYQWAGQGALDLQGKDKGKPVKMRVVNGSAYMGADDTGAAAMGGKHWIDMSSMTAAMGGAGADPFTGLFVLLNPANELTVASQSSTLTKVGTEQVGGGSTTHYRSSTPAADLVAKLPNLTDAQRKAAQSMASEGGANLIFDFWLNGKHELVQMEQQNSDSSSPAPAASPSDSSDSSATMIQFTNLGVKVNVSAPAASDVASPADAAKWFAAQGSDNSNN
ncbi:hypothetical protein [Kitasatospora sp. LaBMicrA B282]|uniref:hypothetical protein n=1 Tax=Kitasatospora sp. LaBMicrA B282 TaxID=3420949 RepID=UPI003D152129